MLKSKIDKCHLDGRYYVIINRGYVGRHSSKSFLPTRTMLSQDGLLAGLRAGGVHLCSS